MTFPLTGTADRPLFHNPPPLPQLQQTLHLKVGVKLFFAFVLFHSVGLWVFAFLFCVYT